MYAGSQVTADDAHAEVHGDDLDVLAHRRDQLVDRAAAGRVDFANRLLQQLKTGANALDLAAAMPEAGGDTRCVMPDGGVDLSRPPRRLSWWLGALI